MEIGIVSSIDESCGNATFAQHLIDSINSQGHTALPIRVNLNLTQSMDPKLRKLADIHIKEVASRIRLLDGVNIQFEAGLYGASHKDIIRRLKILIQANSNTSVTLHATRYFDNSSNSINGVLKNLAHLRFRAALIQVAHIKNTRKTLSVNRSYAVLLAKNKVKIIVHTKKSYDAVVAITRSNDVRVHPIKFCNPNDGQDRLEIWKKRLHFEKDDKIIGIFGFISEYKGHHQALRALNELPPHFKLVIAGKQHPGSIKEHENVNPYLNSLLEFIEMKSSKKTSKGIVSGKLPINKRVVFLNELSDEELFELAASVDFAWLPYLETGQDGSGIASILFDLSKRVIASNCKAFDELIRLIPEYKCERFDIGNHFELADKTLNYREFRKLDSPLAYSDESQTRMYIDLLTT